MKACLLFRDRDFDVESELPHNAAALTQDLGLATLLEAMAAGDEYLLDVCERVVLSSLDDPDAVVYRQEILRDCLEQPDVVTEIYAIVVRSLKQARSESIWRGRTPETRLRGSVTTLEVVVDGLRQLRRISDEHATKFRSSGLVSFFRMITDELGDEYFDTVEGHLARLRFRDGVLISAHLGRGNKGADYVLRRPPETRQSWLGRLSTRSRSKYSFQIASRDEAGAKALGELRARGIALVANALSQSTDHILGFLRMVRAELAFYLGCINLHARLTEKGEPTCFPVPREPRMTALSARGLYDAGLSLLQEGRVVGNDVDADGKSLVMITGANQGGKSTFLRSIGLAQVMMQCGMFVPARSLRASVCHGLFTHFKREEDPTMKSGKLDEELSRMSEIADVVSPHSMLLCNESFAATNEREGSELARQVIRAMREAGVRVLYVSHLFDLAQSLFTQQRDSALFLRAEREPDGRRTFQLVEGGPLPTSYGEDLYLRIFGTGTPGLRAS
jgi:hypothetical protein